MKKTKKRKDILQFGIFLAVFVLAMVGFGIYMWRDSVSQNDNPKQEVAAEPEKIEVEIKEDVVELTVSAAGDCTLGTDKNFSHSTSFNAVYDAQNNPAYFFANVKSIFEADDLTIVNLEGTLTESTTRMDKTFAFKGEPKYAGILTAGSVEAVNLANNHSHDYGTKSYTDTIANVEATGVTTFGYDRVAVKEVKGIKVGLVGIYELADGLGRKQQVINNIKKAEEQGAQLIIVSFHWGTERKNYPDHIQKTLAHLAIDQGADLVLGHHPHVLQGIETYQGKKIVYSLANFCFGGNKNPSDKDTMIFQQKFTFRNGELVVDDMTTIIPCSVSSVSNKNNYQPTPLTGAAAERVMNRIQTYSAGITQ